MGVKVNLCLCSSSHPILHLTHAIHISKKTNRYLWIYTHIYINQISCIIYYLYHVLHISLFKYIYIFLTYIVLTIPYSFNAHFFKNSTKCIFTLEKLKKWKQREDQWLAHPFPRVTLSNGWFSLKKYTHIHTCKHTKVWGLPQCFLIFITREYCFGIFLKIMCDISQRRQRMPYIKQRFVSLEWGKCHFNYLFFQEL